MPYDFKKWCSHSMLSSKLVDYSKDSFWWWLTHYSKWDLPQMKVAPSYCRRKSLWLSSCDYLFLMHKTPCMTTFLLPASTLLQRDQDLVAGPNIWFTWLIGKMRPVIPTPSHQTIGWNHSQFDPMFTIIFSETKSNSSPLKYIYLYDCC